MGPESDGREEDPIVMYCSRQFSERYVNELRMCATETNLSMSRSFA